MLVLNASTRLDEHSDVRASKGSGVFVVDSHADPRTNLALQTRVVGGARGFVGTYGGLSYVGPVYGVPSIGFYSHASELIPAHLDVGWRLGRAMDAPLTSLHVSSADTLQMLLGPSAPAAATATQFAGLPAASAGPR